MSCDCPTVLGRTSSLVISPFDFTPDPASTGYVHRRALPKRFSVSATWFAVMVLLSDDYLKPNDDRTRYQGLRRWCALVVRLPMELQMVLGLRMCQRGRDIVRCWESGHVFKKLLTQEWSSPSVPHLLPVKVHRDRPIRRQLCRGEKQEEENMRAWDQRAAQRKRK